MSYYSEVMADSPVGYWRLGESAGTTADNAEGTSARDGTYTGTYTLGQTGAVPGDTAVLLSTGYISVPYSAAMHPADTFTWEAWVKRTSTGAQMSLWASGEANTVYLYFNATDYLVMRKDSVATICETIGASTDTASWHHIAFTKTGATYAIYYDGSATTLTDVGNQTLVAGTAALNIGAVSGVQTLLGTIDEVALYSTALSSTRIAAHYAAGTVVTPVWTTPADTVSMSTTPELKFNSPTSAVKQHFYLQLDTANTFATGNLRTLDSSTSQTNWAYWDGAAWTALPSDGLPIAKSGNEIRYTVTSALSSATWYRRVRAGTLV